MVNTFYVKAKSKKAINEALEAGTVVYGVNHSMFGGESGNIAKIAQDGDVIKVYQNTVNGSPYAKAYGNWNAKKGRVK